MTDTKTKVVLGVFPDRGAAERVMDSLRHAGFPADAIGFMTRSEAGTAATTPTAHLEQQAEDGAVGGAVAGGAVGAVAGAAAVALVPGFGPVLAGGMLLGILGGAAAGAAVGTYLGPFVTMGLSNEEAKLFEEEFNQGRTIVTVRSEDRFDEAMDILRRHGATRVSAPAPLDIAASEPN